MWYCLTHNSGSSFLKNRQGNDNLEQQAQALFKSWFVDFEPFRGGEFVDSVDECVFSYFCHSVRQLDVC